jgi:FtsH-binding integral membrane protein
MEPRYQGGIVNRGAATTADIDVGLRAYMLKVYNYMAVGMVLTGVVALAVIQIPAISQLFYHMVPTVSGGLVPKMTILGWVAFFAPLVMVFILAARIQSMSASGAQTMFWVYAGLVGLMLAPILVVYTGMSIAKVFFMTAGMFGAMSLYGYTTKRDLSKMGAFLFMGLIGLLIAILVNLFLQSPALHFAISIIGVLIFVGLTAWDTQRIKEMYVASDGGDTITRKAVMGALMLYLDFLNMFLFLLMLFGNRQ